MSEIKIKIAEKDELEKWDQLVDISPQGTIFHKLDWLKAAEEYSKTTLIPLIGYRGEKIVALFPVFYRKRYIFKMIFSPPPGCAIPYMGPIFENLEIFKQDRKEFIVREFIYNAIEIIENKFNPNYFSVSTSPELNDVRPFTWNSFNVSPRYDYLLNLETDPEIIISNFPSTLRRNIKRAEKEEIEVIIGSEQEAQRIFYLVNERYDEQDIAFSLSIDYLNTIYHKFHSRNLKVFVLKYKNDVIGGGIKLIYKNNVIDWFGHSKIDLFRGSPNDLLHFETIKWAHNEGLSKYIIIGANTRRISEYKSKFNPILQLSFTAEKTIALTRILRSAYLLKKYRTRRKKRM